MITKLATFVGSRSARGSRNVWSLFEDAGLSENPGSRSCLGWVGVRSRPQVELQIVEVDTPSGQESLLRHEIDIAIIRLSRPVRSLRTQPWGRDSFVIAIPVEHALATDAAGPVGLARFADEPWVWLRRDASPDYHDQLMATCRRAGFSPDVRHLANSITTQLAMVAAGLGVTLVPNVLARSIQPPVTYRPLTDRADLVELSLVTRDSTQEPLVREFLRIESLPG